MNFANGCLDLTGHNSDHKINTLSVYLAYYLRLQPLTDGDDSMMHCKNSVLIIATLLCACSCNSKKKRGDQPAQTSPASSATNQLNSDSGVESDSLGKYVSFPTAGVKLRQPAGFQKSDNFDGFGHSETQSSILVMVLPGPYSETISGFTQSGMKSRGWTMHSRQDVEVDGLPGILINFEQPAGGEVYTKWSLAFGSDRKTTLITATFPKNYERDFSDLLKSVVLSARLDTASPPELGSDLPFTLTTSTKLKLTPGINKMLLYTRDGFIPTKSPSDPLFIVAPGLAIVNEGKRQFAEQQLYSTAEAKQIAVKSTNDIQIDGLGGYESLAEAIDAKTGLNLILYQVMLFDDDSYIRIVGLVGAGLSGDFLPEFKTMARSLRKRKA